MTAGVSSWWATPTAVDRHFSADELHRSADYHRTLRRVGLTATAAKVLLLACSIPIAAWFAGRLDGGRFDTRWFDGGPIIWLFSPRLLVGAGLVTAAVRAPAVAADVWFEFAFRRGRPDHQPVPVLWFAATAVTLALGVFVGLVVIGGLAYRLAASRSDWPLILILVAAAVAVVSAGWERWVRQRVPAGEVTLEVDSDPHRELTTVADRFGLAGMAFAVVSRGLNGDPDAEHPPNAYSAGLGRHRRIVVTEALLGRDRATRDFVVAHELTHLARHHVLAQSVAGSAVPIVAVVMLATLVGSGPWAGIGLDALDPLGLPVTALTVAAVLVVLGPPLAWLSRVHERVADRGAVQALGPLPSEAARQLYLATTVDLDPPWWVRLYAPHPAPAERLEFLSRAARARHR